MCDRDEPGEFKTIKMTSELYEWVAPDGTIYRAKDPAILDRRRLPKEEDDGA